MNFEVLNLIRKPSNGAVIAADWRAYKSTGEHEAEYTTTSHFNPDPLDANFTPYENITEESVIEWVKEISDLVGLEALLDSDLEALTGSEPVSGTPW